MSPSAPPRAFSSETAFGSWDDNAPPRQSGTWSREPDSGTRDEKASAQECEASTAGRRHSRGAQADGCGAGTRQAGFTLIEVLVAIAVTATVLGAIGALMGSNGRTARRLEERVALMATARAVEAGIPPREALRVGQLDGEISSYRWRMDIRPFATGDGEEAPRWVPLRVLIRVRAPSGALAVVETIRLARSGAE